MPSSSTEYQTLGPLQTRIETHRRYSERRDDVEQAVLDAIVLGTDDALLDVGCGTGSFLDRVRRAGHRGRLVGLDTSPAAIAELDRVDGAEGVLADATELPFADGEFDVVTARHMLYHVSDLDTALREARRVLRTGGSFAAVVNLTHSTPEVDDLIRSVVADHGVKLPASTHRKVHSGNLPAHIETAFGNVTVVEHHNALAFPTADSFARYAVALLSFYGVESDAPNHPAITDALVAEAHRRFATRDGHLRDPKGYVVCAARAQARPAM